MIKGRFSTMTALLGGTLLTLALAAVPATARPPALPLGDAGLPETRSTSTLAPGVTLTTIVRGDEPADPAEIPTTTKGPWRVFLLTIDPRKASGGIRAVKGSDLAKVETTSQLTAEAGALAGVNASFFTFTASQQYPGDPVGLGVYDGRLLSEPTGDPAEASVLFDRDGLRPSYGPFSWTGHVQSRDLRVGLEFVNHPPVLPAGCDAMTDQSACPSDGDTVQFTPEFAASTPSGPGTELVLDSRGCVKRRADQRGTALAEGETSLQATGSDVVALRRLTGCLELASTLRDESGREVRLGRDSQAVNGRYQLLRDGENILPSIDNSFFGRNPRTFIGTKETGELVIGVIDGRQTTSVGTTLEETAAVAKALGLRDAINLDGGGSSTMVAKGGLINKPAGSAERKVGDALVYTP